MCAFQWQQEFQSWVQNRSFPEEAAEKEDSQGEHHFTCKLSIIRILVLDNVNASVVPIGWDEQMPRIADKEGGVGRLAWMENPP